MNGVSIYCPSCLRYTALSEAPTHVRKRGIDVWGWAVWTNDQRDVWWIGLCNFCQKPVLVLNRGQEVYPTPAPKPTDPNIPTAIREDLDEAKRCFQVKAWRACAVMARRTLQSTAKDKGATNGNLVHQINELASNGVITADIKKWADVVRWVGNDAAHPNDLPVTKEDAEDILQLAEQLLQVVYVAPAIAASRQNLRGK